MAAVAMLFGVMPDIRSIVLRELARRGWSHYQLVQSLKGRRPGGKDVPAATVYDFLRGDSTLNSEYLGYILDSLGLSLSRKKKEKHNDSNS